LNEAKMKHLIAILIVAFIFSCKETPTYNPFDDQYSISINHLKKNNCDTVMAGCGYFNLIEREGKLRMYYQIYGDASNEVVAKGFEYYIDTIEFRNWSTLRDTTGYPYESILDSIASLSFNENKIDNDFRKFGYRVFERKRDRIHLLNSQTNDTLKLKIKAFAIERTASAVRGFSDFRMPPRDAIPY